MTSSKYYTVYQYKNPENSDYNEASVNSWNYNKELVTKVYGDAILETSTSGKYSTAYYGDYSYFPSNEDSFIYRGGRWDHGSGAGLFAFNRANGNQSSLDGFRAVLV